MASLREKPRDRVHGPRDNVVENNAGDSRLLLSTAQCRIADCCCPNKFGCGTREVRVSEAARKAHRICFHQGGHCPFTLAEKNSRNLRQHGFACKERGSSPCGSLFETCHCKSTPWCDTCSTSVCSDLCGRCTCSDSLCCVCCGAPSSCTGPVQRDIRSTSLVTGCLVNEETRASQELFVSMVQLDIVHSFYLLSYRRADPFLPLHFYDGGVMPEAAKDCSAGNKCFDVASKAKTHSVEKCGSGSFFRASFAIRAAQRLTSALRSSPLQLLYRSLQSSRENVSSSSPANALERESQQHKLAQTFPPEPREAGDIFLMRCVFTWGAAASHQLGYEVFSSAVEKLYQPPRCIALFSPEPSNSATGDSTCRQIRHSAAVVDSGPSATAVAVGTNAETSTLSVAPGSFTYEMKEGGSSRFSQNSTCASTTHTASANGGFSNSSSPNTSSWIHIDSSNGGLRRKGSSVASTLQVQFVKCGPSISLAVTLNGEVWVWGKNADGRRRIHTTPVTLEGLELEPDGDRWDESVRPRTRTSRGADKPIGGSTEAGGEAAAGEVPGAAEEGTRQARRGPSRRAGDVGSRLPGAYERTRKGVKLRVIDAAIGAQHCLLLVDVLRDDNTKSQTCNVRMADSSSCPTDVQALAAQLEQDMGRGGEKSSSRTRARRARRPRLDGGTLLPSEPSERLSFQELETTDEEENERGGSPTAETGTGNSAIALPLAAPAGSADAGRNLRVETAAAGRPSSSSLVTERRLYVWGSNGCHQLGFPHYLPEAARHRVDIVSLPHASSVNPCTTASSSSPPPAESSWTVFPSRVPPGTQGVDDAGVTNTADNDGGASAAVVCRAPSCLPDAASGATGARSGAETAEKDCDRQKLELVESAVRMSNKGLHSTRLGTKGRKRPTKGGRQQADLDALASYTPVVLTRTVSDRLHSLPGDIIPISSNSPFGEGSDWKNYSGVPDPPCAPGRNVRGKDAAITAGATRAIPKGLQLQLYVQAVAAGWTHSLLLLQDGRVLVFGDNSYGQCAQHPSVASVSSPTPLAQLPPCCAIVAGQRTSAAVAAPPQSTFVWGGCPVSRLALLAGAAKPSAAAGEPSTTQQRVIPRQKQPCSNSPGIGSQPSAAGDVTTTTVGCASAAATVIEKQKKDVFLALSNSTPCIATGVSIHADRSGGSYPPSSKAFSSTSSTAASTSSSSCAAASPSSYLAYFTPLRLKGSSLLRTPGFFQKRRASSSVSGGCTAAAGQDTGAAALDDEEGWHMQPAARHCPVLLPESIAISDSLGIAVGVDDRLYAWRCRGQRPCVIRPAVAHLPPFSSTSAAHGSPSPVSSSLSCSPSCCATCHCRDASRCIGVPCCSISSSSFSGAASRDCPAPSCSSSLSQSSSCYTSTFDTRALSLTEDSTCSGQGSAATPEKTVARRQAGAATVDGIGSSESVVRETVALRPAAFPSSSSCPCVPAAVRQERATQLLQPPCRVKQLVVTSTRVYLLTEDGLLFSATSSSDASEPAATGRAVSSSSSPGFCTSSLKPLQQGQNEQRQGVRQQERLHEKYQEQLNQKQLQRLQRQQQQQEQHFWRKDQPVEGEAYRNSEPEYFSFCFQPIRGLASVQQISASDTHAAAVVAMYSPSFPPYFSKLPSSSPSECPRCFDTCLSASPAASRVPVAASGDGLAASPSWDFSGSPPSAAAHAGQWEPRSSGAGGGSATAAPLAAAASVSTAVSATPYRNTNAALDACARRVLPNGATSVSAGHTPDALPHTACDASPCAPPAATAAGAALCSQACAAGAVARTAADLFAGSPAGVPACLPSSAASEDRVHVGAANLPFADLFTAVVGGSSDQLRAAGVTHGSAFAAVPTGVAACTAAAPRCPTYPAATVGGSLRTGVDATPSAARAVCLPGFRPAPENAGIDLFSFTGAEAGGVPAVTPPSLGFLAARALLRVKAPLPPSISFLLYTVAPAALFVRDKSLFDFCCLYLLLNLPLVFAALGGATLPPPPPPAPLLTTESKVGAKQKNGGSSVWCCRCSSCARCCCSSSSILKSSSTDSCTISNRSSSSSSKITKSINDSSSGRVKVNHNNVFAVAREMAGQLERTENDPRYVPAAAGMQYLLRGLAELLVFESCGRLRLPLSQGGRCSAAGPLWPRLSCYCCSTQAGAPQETQLDAVDCHCDTSAAVTRKRSLSQRHLGASSCAGILSVENEGILALTESRGTAEASGHAAGSPSFSSAPIALCLRAAGRQRGWWEADGTEDEVEEAENGGAQSTTAIQVDHVYNGDRREAVVRRICLSQARNIRVPARDAAEGWAAEEAMLLRLLRTAALDFLRSYVYLPVNSKRATTERDAVDAQWLKGRLAVFASEGPLQENTQLLHRDHEALQQQNEEEEHLREFFSACLAAAGAADRLIERLQQPLLQLLQRRASGLVERCSSSGSERRIGKGLHKQALHSDCSYHDTFERRLVLQCWSNMLWFPVCRGAPHRNLTGAAVEEYETLERKVKTKTEHKAALNRGEANDAGELDTRKINRERSIVRERFKEDTCHAGTAKKVHIIVEVVGAESECGGRFAARSETAATPALTAIAGAVTRRVSAALSPAEEETSACRDSGQRQDCLALGDPLNSQPAEVVLRREKDTPGASSKYPCVTAARTTPTGPLLKFPLLAASTGRSHSPLTTCGTLRQSLNGSTSGETGAPPPAREPVASAAFACDAASWPVAKSAVSAAVEVDETPVPPTASLFTGATPAEGRRSVWSANNQGHEAADEKAIPASAAPPATANSISRTSPATAAGSDTQTTGTSLRTRDLYEDRGSPPRAGKTCCTAAWQVWSKRKHQQKKETCARSTIAERETGDLSACRSPAVGGTQRAMNSESTRAVHAAAGGSGIVPVAAEAAGTRKGGSGHAAVVGMSARENGGSCLIRHFSSAEKTSGCKSPVAVSGACAHVRESDITGTFSATVPCRVNRAGPQAVVDVRLHHQQPVRRFSVSLKDFLVVPLHAQGRKQKGMEGAGGKEISDERRKNEKDADLSQAGDKSAATAVLAQQARRRRWRQGLVAAGTEDEAKSSNSKGNNSHSSSGHSSTRNNASSSSASTSCSNSSSSTTCTTDSNRPTTVGCRSSKSSSGTCGEESTDNTEVDKGRRRSEEVSLKPQSLAEVMREEEELQRQKQLKRQWQLQREREQLAATATGGTEQPTLILRFRSCSQGVTALAVSKGHIVKERESKRTNKAAQTLLQQAARANDDAGGSRAAPWHLSGKNGILNTSNCHSAGNGGRANSSSTTSPGSCATRNTSSSNSSNAKLHGDKRKKSFIENEGCLDAVASISGGKVAPTASRSSQVRGGASFNCWGLEAALRAQGEGAVDLAEVQQEQLQEQLAHQRQQEEEADLQEALWLISKAEEREKKEATRLEMEAKREAAATPDTASVVLSTPPTATLAEETAAGREGSRRVAAEPSPQACTAANGETAPRAFPAASTEKLRCGPAPEVYNSRLNTVGPPNAYDHQCGTLRLRREQGQRRWQYRKQTQHQMRYLKDKTLP